MTELFQAETKNNKGDVAKGLAYHAVGGGNFLSHALEAAGAVLRGRSVAALGVGICAVAVGVVYAAQAVGLTVFVAAVAAASTTAVALTAASLIGRMFTPHTWRDKIPQASAKRVRVTSATLATSVVLACGGLAGAWASKADKALATQEKTPAPVVSSQVPRP